MDMVVEKLVVAIDYRIPREPHLKLQSSRGGGQLWYRRLDFPPWSWTPGT